jgi:phosphoglycolate phosphatase-like HAD superfamily hydrolase
MTCVRIIILDFDGVILESVSVKTEAFRRLFSFAPEHVDEITRFHLENGGMSRYDKFRYIYRNILRENLSNKKFGRLSEQFALLVKDAVIRIPFVSGAEAFLRQFYRKAPLYIVSATPQEELEEIVRKRGLSKYFSGIFGSPVPKTEHLTAIVTNIGADPKSVVFIGDAMNDCKAAEKAGVRFIGRIPPDNANPFAGCPAVERTVRDLYELAVCLEPILC